MEAYRTIIILSCVFAYFALCLGVGVWSMRRTKSADDFFMAGRSLGIFITAVAVFSSTMSGFGFVGGPGLVYQMGMSSIAIIVTTSLGFCISFYLLAKRLRMIAGIKNSVSLPDVVSARYNSRAVGFLTAVAILLGVVAYLATQILAMATVLQTLLKPYWETSLFMSAGISTAVLVFYCVTGGIIASVYTDAVQGVVMMVAAVLVFVTAMVVVEGGFTGMTDAIIEQDKPSMSPWGTFGMFGALSWYFVFALGGAGQPHVVTKMMMHKRIEHTRHMLPLAVCGYAVTALLWVGIGLAMRAKVASGEHPPLADPNEAAPMFLQVFANPLLAGIVFSGLFAAIMSTADAFLNIGTAAVVHDIPRAILGRRIRNELHWARIVTVLLAVAGMATALMSSKKIIALLGAFGWGMFAAALVPVVAIGFNWKRATPLAAGTAIVAGLLVNFTPQISELLVPTVLDAPFKTPFGVDIGALALLTSLTLFLGISLLSKPRKLDPEIEAVMDL